MAQAPKLKITINNKIRRAIDIQYASGFEIGKKYSISIRFHAEVDNGEDASLRSFLHGSNSTVGDFEIVGEFSFEPNGDELIAEFSVDCIWNDVIDPNYYYWTDRIKSAVINMVTFGSPQKYDLHICWNMDNNGINDYTGAYMSPKELWDR